MSATSKRRHSAVRDQLGARSGRRLRRPGCRGGRHVPRGRASRRAAGAVDADANGIVVDLTECEFIDSSAIRALLLSREQKNPDDGRESLAVAASSDQILRILSVMGLDQVLPIEPTVDQAAAALSG